VLEPECSVESDCALPQTDPAGCARAACSGGRCVYSARDEDGDGHASLLCAPVDPEGTIRVGDDCDDHAKAIHPQAAELCNGLDDDCNGVTDVQQGSSTSVPPAPGATLTCSDGTWHVSAWFADGYVTPKDDYPWGVCEVLQVVLWDARGESVLMGALPSTLIRVERDSMQSPPHTGDHTMFTLDFEVLRGLPPATRDRVIEVFTESGVGNVTLQLTVELQVGFPIPALGLPFLFE
jgi:hypothetical protein